MGAKQRLPIASLETQYMKQQEMAAKLARKRKKLLLRRLSVFLILTIACTYLLVSTLIARTSALESKQEEKQLLQQELSKLEKKQSLLENEIVKLNDDEYIAKLARSEYFLSDKGETIFNIPEPKKKAKEKEKDK